jgi:hypothetical protein
MLRCLDLRNATIVRSDRTHLDIPSQSTKVYGTGYAKKKKQHQAALKSAKDYVPPAAESIPSCYSIPNSKGEIATHIDIAAFKGLWDTKLKTSLHMKQSKLKGCGYKDKIRARCWLMEEAVKGDVVVLNKINK